MAFTKKKRSRKRANGEGTIFKMANGRWKGVISVGSTSGGKRRRISRTGKSQADVVTELAKLRNQIEAGSYVEPSKVTVGQLLDRWFEAKVKPHSAESTAELYRSMIDRILKVRPIEKNGLPLGDLPAQKLRLATVQKFVDYMAITEEDGSSTAVPSRTRQVALLVLRKAMIYSAKLGEIAGDPTAGVDRPKHDARDIFPFEMSEAEAILADAKKTRDYALVVLALTGGMRMPPLPASPWDAVDLESKTIRIFQQAAEVKGRVTIKRPKTRTSIRTIHLTKLAVQALEIHRGIQEQEGLSGSELVFPAPEGGVMSRSNYRKRVWLPRLKKLGLKPRGIHHTRHTYATLALGAGVPVHVVSKVMGHAKPSTTHNTYAHLLKDQQGQATSAMGRLFK